jgi:hypothetical protein
MGSDADNAPYPVKKIQDPAENSRTQHGVFTGIQGICF